MSARIVTTALVGLVALVALLLGTSIARADQVVALAPLSTLGTEDTSAATKKLLAQIEAALATLPGTRVITAAEVSEQLKKAKKQQLRACEGDVKCLAEVGTLVGAQIVIAGEVGGLGESQVVYLSATDVATAKELRSTTLTVGAKDDGGGAAGAAVRLLDPERYRGTLHFTIDVTNATIYVNGTKATPPPSGELTLPVGTHAVRVTHPEYHDFVKFETVTFGQTAEVRVGMQQYPIIQHDLTGKPLDRAQIEVIEPPVWRRWYVIGPAAIGVAIVTAIIVGIAVHDYPNGTCRQVGSTAGC